jgi:hypothetical protein
MPRKSLRFVLSLALPLSLGCGGAEAPAPRPAPPAPVPSSEVMVQYREAANVFEILDNVSNWLPDKCDAEYRAEWERRFGITPEDERSFAAYKEIRKRYYPPPPEVPPGGPAKTEHGLFAPGKPPDRIAETFYASDTLPEAFSGLRDFVKPEDVKALEAFYEAHRAHYEVLLAESRSYPDLAQNLKSKLDAAGADAYFERIAHFYGVTERIRFTALYVWWPPVEAVTANNRGRYLILKYNPVKHRESALRDIEIPVHELTHWISAHQPAAQKQALTRAFLSGCDLTAKLQGPRILEEPLAVVHQKMFLGLVDPGRLEFSSSWYGDPWIGTFAKLLYHPVADAQAKGGKLDEKLMKQAAKACAHLEVVAKLLR